MEVEIILIVVLLCIGAVQGLVYGVMFWRTRGPNRIPNRILAVILFFLSYRLTIETLLLFGLGEYDILYHWMIDFNWIYGPLIYFYVKSQLQPDFRFQKQDGVHFIPVGIQFLCSNFVRAQNFYWDGTHESLSWLGRQAYIIWMNYPTIYIIASLLIVFYSLKAEKLLNQVRQSAGKKQEKLTWIGKVIFFFRIYFMIVLSILIIDWLFFPDIEYYYFTRFYYYPLFVGVAVLTYWLGIAGFSRKDQIPYKPQPTLSIEKKDQLQSIAQLLNRSMNEDKLYKNPELSLASLAEQLNTKPYLLSSCLKTQFQTKFNDFVNEHRLQELVRLLQDEDNEKFTLLSLAYEAGFNSKASFNRATKKHLGITPSELKKQLTENH
jgi:AraC-like DNA-binding protein